MSKMPPRKIFFYNEDIVYPLNKLVRGVRKLVAPESTVVLGVLRGGVVPALWVSHALDVEMQCVGVRSYTGMKRGGVDFYSWPFFAEAPERTVVIVDDIVDSGETMKQVEAYARENSNVTRRAVRKTADLRIITASLFAFDDTQKRPDVVGRWIDRSEHDWVVFPWEVDR